MTLPICYLAGPYAAPTAEERAENVRRIGRICRWLTQDQGFAVVTVHAALHAGHYGDDDNPKHRAQGIAADLELVRMVRAAGGRFFALSRDDGSLSTGTQQEAEAFGPRVVKLTWAEWLASGVEP